jgi:GAF domain-containing protein
MTAQLVELIDNLEVRVQERTQDLERRTAQLKAATEVGRAVATLHDLDRLLSIVTRLISESFGFYHVGIFLLDEAGENAVLRAANSAGGQRMLEKGHQLKIGQQGIVGYATQRREPRIALNVGDDSAHFVNPYLPETKSEMALPLVVGGQLLGALDVQSRERDAFSQQDVETLQVLADQVAIAISNANLVAQTQELLESERRAYRDITRMNWREFSQSQHTPGYVRTRAGLEPLDISSTPVTAYHDPGTHVEADNPQVLLTPVIVRGEQIALLRTRKPDYAGSWAPSEIQILNEMANQLALALESARAYQETQTRATRERIAAQVTADIRQNLDLESMLQTATREVRRSMGLSRVVIQIVPPGKETTVEVDQDSDQAEKNTNGNSNGRHPHLSDNNNATGDNPPSPNGGNH